VAEEGDDAQIGWDFNAGHFFQQLDPRAVACSAADKALRLLGAVPIDSMRCPAILDPYVATELLEVLAAAFLAENVMKGKSLLAGRVGTAIASSQVTIVDDGTLPGGLATTPFDAEGVPHRPTVLVDRGDLQGYLYDTYHGARMGQPSSGNAVRGGVKGLPHLGITNLFLQPAATPAAQLLAGIERGIYLTDVMGMHTADPISGDFSVGASGLLIEGGVLTSPVRGIAVAGNLLELLARIDGVGDDLRFFGSVGAPSLRLSALDVSGQ
jgi:PmbA protein